MPAPDDPRIGMNFSGTARFRQSRNFFFQNHVNYRLHPEYLGTFCHNKKEWTKEEKCGIIN
jgi:hypothetical protein